MSQRFTPRLQLRVRDEHRPECAHLLDQPREVREVDPSARRDHVARRVAPRDLELHVVDRGPDLHDVAAERTARLGADRHHDRLERCALLEARRHRENAIERLAGAPLELVQPGALERLTTEVRGDPGERSHLGGDRVGLLERESHCTGKPLADEDRHRQRARGVRRERSALGVLRDELRPALHPRRLSLARCGGDGSPRRQREAGAGTEGLPPRPARVDDHELLPLDEAERAASRADRDRHALDHHGGDFLHGECSRERRGKGLQALDAEPRSFLVLRRLGGALLAAAHGDADSGNEHADCQGGRPAHEVVARGEARRHAGRRDRVRGERPTGDQGGDDAGLPGHPHRHGDRAEERRVDDLVAETFERFGDEHADGADREAERDGCDDATDVRAEIADRRLLSAFESAPSSQLACEEPV